MSGNSKVVGSDAAEQGDEAGEARPGWSFAAHPQCKPTMKPGKPPTLGPKLRGKVNLFCGDADTFHLDEAFKLLCDFLKQRGSDAVCELVPGRDHMNLALCVARHAKMLSNE